VKEDTPERGIFGAFIVVVAILAILVSFKLGPPLLTITLIAIVVARLVPWTRRLRENPNHNTQRRQGR
jgi:membrane protein implicated in regulation of membrane protease activity